MRAWGTWRTIGAGAVALAVWAVATALGSGCQAVVGTTTRNADPLATSCALPAGTSPIRIANVLPRAGALDFCVRPSGTAYGRPLYLGGGACSRGLAYAQVSVPFATSGGAIDVKAIPYGSLCGAPALAEITNVPTGAEPTTIAAMGTVSTPAGSAPPSAKLVAFPEAAPVSAYALIRVIDAAADSPALFFGVPDSGQLPAKVTPIVSSPIAFGSALKPETNQLTVNAQGYIEFAANTLTYAMAENGSTAAVSLFTFPKPSGTNSIYAIGSKTDPKFPVRALICRDGETDATGLLTSCTLSPLPTITVDVWGTDLNGSENPGAYQARRPAILRQLSSRTTADIMCLTGVTIDSDKAAIVQAMNHAYAYSYYPNDANHPKDLTLDSRPTPDTTWGPGGAVPDPIPSTPSCNTGDANLDLTNVSATIQCLQQNCTDPTGAVSDVFNCTHANCLGSVAPLALSAYRPDRVCLECVADAITDFTPLTPAFDTCKTDRRKSYTGGGAGTTMILSKFPLKNEDRLLLPSTFTHRTVLYAEAMIDATAGTSVAFFCAELSQGVATGINYSGDYGNGSVKDGWHQEQLWQVPRVAAWIQQKAASLPTVVAGDWEASVYADSPDAGTTVDTAQNPDVLAALTNPASAGGAGLRPALPSPFSPFCTECPNGQDSLNASGTLGSLFEGVYVNQAFPQTSIIDASTFFNGTVMLGDGTVGPTSHHFGFNIMLERP